MTHSLDLSKIGGSDLAVIAGVRLAYETPATLAARIRTGGETAVDRNDWMSMRGKEAEPLMRDWFERRFDCQVQQIESLSGTWWRASPDGIATRIGEPDELVEIKNWEGHRRAEFGAPGTDEVPIELTLQVQWYLRALGLEWANVVVSFGNREPEVWRLRADPELQQRIGRMAYRFYQLALRTEPIFVPLPKQPVAGRVVFELADTDLIARVGYMAKAKRIHETAKKRFELARQWAFSHVGNQPATIHTPTHVVSIYETKGSLALRLQEKKK
ncbi:MAG: YqaJ viral recombinase family protein [Acidobacteria bacterium]|nr:YqaJ viral recombinase family protein [Acidobacteriota bacterium]